MISAASELRAPRENIGGQARVPKRLLAMVDEVVTQ